MIRIGVEAPQIAELLMSHIVGLRLRPAVYDQLSVYLDLLLRWNAKTNLTAIRDPEQMVRRHFGESLFAAGVLFGNRSPSSAQSSRAEVAAATGAEGPAFSDNRQLTTDNSFSSVAPPIPRVGMSGTREAALTATTLADLGSGAGFPGLPIKLAFPALQVTLIESQNKKATFLKEVIRALRLDGIEVYTGRAEQWGKHADVVTMRAVEKFESAIRVSSQILAVDGRLCLLIGEGQKIWVADIPGFAIEVVERIPATADSIVLVGSWQY
jgi:16S rRNA (guanine527-N7)-methyltransferase